MKTKAVSKLFNQAIFRVPDYQRGYSWSQKQLEQFWDDLGKLDKDKEHYTGLLTIEEAHDIDVNKKWEDVRWIITSSDYKAYYIVDGQQRLTTIIILIQSIIEKLNDDDKLNLRSKSQIIEQYICIKDENLKAYMFGYEKDDPSYEFLKSEIFNDNSSNKLNTPLSLYTHNLSFAKSFFDLKIRSYNTDKLEELFKKVSLRLKFNLYEVDSDLDVFVMFETMNNRGKPLSKLELLKNRLIYLSTILPDTSDEKKSEIRNDINNSWKTIYEYLGKNDKDKLDDDEFLKYHTYMYFHYMDDKADVYAEFLLDEHFTTSKVYSKEITIKSLEKYAQSIQNSIVIWFDIKFPFLNNRSDIDYETRVWISKLTRLKSFYFLPSVVGVILYKDSKEIGYSNEQIVRLLKAMEKFSFLSFYVYQKNSNYKKNLFLGYANKIYEGSMSVSQFVLEIEDSSKQQSNYIDDFHLKLSRYFGDENKSGFYGWPGLHYFLYEFECDLQGSEQQKITWDKAKQSTSIEHIYPQTPDEDWLAAFREHNEMQRRLLCNSLGNLLLISSQKNSSLRNKGFGYKKMHAGGDGCEITNGYFNGSHSEIDVAQFPQWTAREILLRGLKMLAFMEKRWGVRFNGEMEKKKILFLQFVKSTEMLEDE